MDQSTAKEQFVYYLSKVDLLSDGTMSEWLEGDDAVVNPSEELDRLGEFLWGCHDVVNAPASALDAIRCEPGVTFHEAVLWRAVEWLAEQGDDIEVAHNLYDVFVKDQRGRHGAEATVNRTTFHAWLSGYMPDEAQKMIDLWDGTKRLESSK